MQRCTLVLLLLVFSCLSDNKEFNKVNNKEFHKTIIIHSVNGKITVEIIDNKETESAKPNRDESAAHECQDWFEDYTDANGN